MSLEKSRVVVVARTVAGYLGAPAAVCVGARHVDPAVAGDVARQAAESCGDSQDIKGSEHDDISRICDTWSLWVNWH